MRYAISLGPKIINFCGTTVISEWYCEKQRETFISGIVRQTKLLEVDRLTHGTFKHLQNVIMFKK